MVRSRKPSNVTKFTHQDHNLNSSDHQLINDQVTSEEPLLPQQAPSSPSLTPIRTRHRSPQPLNPVPPRLFVIVSLIASSLILSFFFLAPSLGPLFRLPLPPASKQIRPVGPPGSITDKTVKWANQGGAWNNVDLDAAFKNASAAAPLSNGTHAYRRTVIVISLDGFRWPISHPPPPLSLSLSLESLLIVWHLN